MFSDIRKLSSLVGMLKILMEVNPCAMFKRLNFMVLTPVSCGGIFIFDFALIKKFM